MKVKHIMTREVMVASPGDSICVAAQRMAECEPAGIRRFRDQQVDVDGRPQRILE